jgi:hypothetical protein
MKLYVLAENERIIVGVCSPDIVLSSRITASLFISKC